MPSTKNIGDIVRRLGLLAPLTKQAKDWSLQPAVKALYVEDIDNLSKQFQAQSNEDIRASRELRRSANTLLRTHAPLIWRRGPRPWTLQPNDERANGNYPRHLYWDDDEDLTFITETFHELVIDKVIRYRQDKNKLRISSVTTDPTWTADAPRRMTTNFTAGSLQFTCFAPAGSDHDHADASLLKEHGVWLRDWYEEDCVVTSLSFKEVIARYYDSTEGGLLKTSTEGPQVNAWHAQDPDKTMWCLACRDRGRKASSGIFIKHAEFIHESDVQTIVAEPMRRTVWVYPCSLEGRTVFAMVKCEKLRYDSAYLWSFYKVDGGYTKDVFLTAVPKQSEQASTAVENNSSPQVVRRVDMEGNEGEPALQTSYELRSRRARPYDDSGNEERVQHETDASPQLLRQSQSIESEHRRGHRTESQHAGISTDLSQSVPEHSVSEDGVARGEREPTVDDLVRELRLGDIASRGKKRRANSEAASAPSRQRRRMDESQPHNAGMQKVSTTSRAARGYTRVDDGDFDEDYDVTPGADDRRRAANAATNAQAENATPTHASNAFFKRFAAPDANTGPSRSHSPQEAPTAAQAAVPPGSSSAKPAAAASENELIVRFKVRDRELSSIVKLTNSTTVQEAFKAIEKRFAYRLEGRSAQALRFAFPNELLGVELDDCDTWEYVLSKLAQLDADGSLSTFEALIEV